MRQGYWIIKGYMSDEDSFGPNDTVEEGEYLDNLKEGTWKRFHSNGNLRSEITYSKNRPYGAYAIYYENSQLEESSTWHRNKNVGDFKRYYSNGQPQQASFLQTMANAMVSKNISMKTDNLLWTWLFRMEKRKANTSGITKMAT